MLFQFFELYEKLLTSANYVTRRQSLKVSLAVNCISLVYWIRISYLEFELTVVWYFLAAFGFSTGGSKLPYNEALHFGSSILKSHDDIAEGIKLLIASFFKKKKPSIF